jgi:branched-subunit amino acid transport protein
MSADVAGLVSAGIAGIALILSVIVAAALPVRPRSYLQFAAALGGALVVADLVAELGGPLFGAGNARLFAGAVALLVAALVPSVLALAVQKRAPGNTLAASVLAASCLAGLVAAMTGAMLFAVTPLAIAALVLGAMAMRAPRRIALFLGLGDAALIAGAAAMQTQSRGHALSEGSLALFLAVGLLGITLALVRRSEAAIKRRQRLRPRTALIRGKD